MKLELLILIFLLGISACTKDPKEKKADLGAPVSTEEVKSALEKAMGDRFPLETKVGDQSLYEINQKIESSDPVKLKESLLEVNKRKEDDQFVTYSLTESLISYEEKNPTISHHPIEWKIAKFHLPELPPLLLSSSFFLNPLFSQSFASNFSFSSSSSFSLFFSLFDFFYPHRVKSEDNSSPPVSFHRLQTIQGKRSVPVDVSKDSECRGLQPCELEISEVSFDLVEWPSPNEGKATQYRYVYASNTPYPAHLVLLCVKKMIETAKRDYFVSQCQVLRDFVFGNKVIHEDHTE